MVGIGSKRGIGRMIREHTDILDKAREMVHHETELMRIKADIQDMILDQRIYELLKIDWAKLRRFGA